MYIDFFTQTSRAIEYIRHQLFVNHLVSFVVVDASEKLGSVKVEVPEVTQSEMGQKQKLREVLDMVNHLLNLTPSWVDQKWTVDSELTYFCTVYFIRVFGCASSFCVIRHVDLPLSSKQLSYCSTQWK